MPLTKYIILSKAKPPLSRAQALGHLRRRHAPLVEASATLRLSLKRYVQNHVMSPAESDPASWDWVIEGWYDDDIPFDRMSDERDLAAVRRDLQTFPDWSTLLRLPVSETTINRGARTGASFKCFEFVRRRRFYSSSEFMTLWAAGDSDRGGEGEEAARMRNLPIGESGRETDFDVIDIQWFADLDEAIAFRQRAVVEITRSTGRGKLVDPERSFVLVAHEHPIFDDVGAGR